MNRVLQINTIKPNKKTQILSFYSDYFLFLSKVASGKLIVIAKFKYHSFFVVTVQGRFHEALLLTCS